MKRNAQKSTAETQIQDSGANDREATHQGNGGTTFVSRLGIQASRQRPEIAVLGWNERSYRLSLRESKI